MEQRPLDFNPPPTPTPRARTRRLLVGGRGQIARQASADGALKAEPRRDSDCLRLERYMRRCGERGATDAEIGEVLEWPANVVTARRNDLVRDGKVVVSWPDCRRESVKGTGVKVVIWLLAEVIEGGRHGTRT